MARWLIAGLGNPGDKYEKTRHNVGFMALDAVSQYMEDPNVVLLKPETFMNNSGQAVKQVMKNRNVKIEHLVVVHDDIDLPLGTLRVSRASGSAGHKGVQSVIDHLGTNEFCRIRVGILPTRGKPKDVENFVLKKFSREEQKHIASAIKSASAAIDTIISESVEQAMHKWN